MDTQRCPHCTSWLNKRLTKDRQWYRRQDGKMIAGVATGLSEQFDLPLAFVRLMFVLSLRPKQHAIADLIDLLAGKKAVVLSGRRAQHGVGMQLAAIRTPKSACGSRWVNLSLRWRRLFVSRRSTRTSTMIAA